MKIEEFYEDLTQDLFSKAGTESNFTRSVFIEHMCNLLTEEGFLSDFNLTEYKFTHKGLAVDAWSYDPEMTCLTLILADYRDSEMPDCLTNSEASSGFKRLSKFLESSLKRDFAESLDVSMPAAELSWLIRDLAPKISKISLVLVSNAELSSRVASLPSERVGGYVTTYDIWDLGRIHRLEISGRAREDVEIDFSHLEGGGIPCLPAYTGEEAMKSYLLVIPASVLSNLYESYGERLLEQNVRTFLQFRGKINKGIRNTIINEPQMFFSYNNGISATAEEIETTPDQRFIGKVRNLQIVNGGQTTASIFTAAKKEKADLQRVYVQVKLSLVPREMVEEVVPRISEYSNTQNKVNAADFFSNHPFHLRMEEFSRRLWAPARDGGLQQTHWFYERTRGQFANLQANLSPSLKKQFLVQNPRTQMVTKTDLAKYVLSFDELPHEVSLGAQKAFAGGSGSVGFVGRIAKNWEKGEGLEFNEGWFQSVIAKGIMFREVDKLVAKQPWYSGYKANVVTYTLAKFASMARESARTVDFLALWKAQKLGKVLENQLMLIAEAVNEILHNPPSDTTSNVSEWAKKPECWQIVFKRNIALLPDVDKNFIEILKQLEREKDDARAQVEQDAIHALTYVVNQGAPYWERLKEWNLSKKKLSPTEVGILDVACSLPRKIPTDKQANLLLRAEKRALQEGFSK